MGIYIWKKIIFVLVIDNDMYYRIKFLTLLFGLPLLLSLSAKAQTVSAATSHRQYEDNRMYAEAAKEKSLLTRGVLAPEYEFLHNGTWYAETKEFKTGELLYNNRMYRGVKMNIDACKNLLVVNTGRITATDRNYVEYAVIGGEKYVNLQFGNKVKDAPEGFCKLIYSGDVSFYSLVRKTLQSSPGYHNGDDIGYVDPDYKDAVQVGMRSVPVETFFSYSKRFYAVKDGVCYPVKSRRALLKLFDKTTAKKLRKYASSRNLDELGVSLEVYASSVLSYWRDELREGAE